MKKTTLYLFCSLLFLSLPSFAIENTNNIKVTKLIETDTSWEKTKIIYPNGDSKITALLVEMQPQAKMQMHYHEVPSFGYILEGKITVQSESGDIKTFSKVIGNRSVDLTWSECNKLMQTLSDAQLIHKRKIQMGLFQ